MLRVWLPLTKDLRNQGLSSATIINNGASTSTAGKLGGCYSFNGSSNYLYTTGQGYFGNNYSFAAWVYTTSTSAKQTIGCIRTAVGSGFSLFLIGGKLRIDPGGNNVQWTTSYTYPANTWFHLVVTYDGTTVKYYINGEYKQSYTTTINSTYWGNTLSFGASQANGSSYGNYLNGRLNDIRVYNHCLSPMEVKELAKGLVLHYPLNRQGWGQENLAKASTSATYMGSFPELKTLTFSGWDIYCNQNLDLTAAEWNALVGTKITYRLWLENVEQTVGTGTGIMLHFRFADGTYQQFGGGKNGTIGSWLAQGESGWVWLTVTVPDPTIRSTPTTISYVQYSIRHNSNNGVSTVRYKCAKVEKGSIATPWCPNSSDELATTMGLNSTTEYDCSGFCNNGTRTGTFTWTSDTPKYAVSQVFNGTDNAIQTPSLPTMIADKNYTIAVWIYKTVIGSKGYQTIYGGPSGFEIEARNGSANETKFVPWNWGKPMASYELNEWNHCVFVHSDADCKIYLNGEYIATGTAKASNPTGNYFVGAWNTATQQNFDGLMSDFRVYATALSADDVKSLYQNCATIDPDGTIRGQIRD